MSPDEHQLDQSNETPDSIRVRVLFFGAARQIVGQDEILLDLRAPALAASAFEQVLERYPSLRRFGRSLLFAVNQEYAQGDAEREVRAGDELAIFPPVSGGAESQTNDKEAEGASHEGKDFFELTTAPIDVGSVARRVVLPECGATVTLDGYVREWTKGRRTRYLVYEAYKSASGSTSLTSASYIARAASKSAKRASSSPSARRTAAPPLKPASGPLKNSNAQCPSGKKSSTKTAKCGSRVSPGLKS
jgi:molybdopterin synthase catalytic subunit